MKVREMIRLLSEEGWLLKRTKGSHRQFGHLQRPGTVTVAGHLSDEIPPGTLKSIFKQAGIEKHK